MRRWLQRGAAAGRLAGARSDLWPAGALATLAYLGWAPFLLVVAPPTPGGISQLGVRIYSSGAYPANLVALAAAALGVFLLLCLAVAAAEAWLIRSTLRAALPVARPQPAPMAPAAVGGLAIILLASLPAALALGGLALGLLAVAPTEFISPQPSSTLFARIAAGVLPLLIVLALAVLVGQALGGVALRLAAVAPMDVRAALVAAARALLRRPWPPLGVVSAGWLKDGLVLVVTFALLRVLWAPIGARLSGGSALDPATLSLLLGFVAIWLSLLLAAGALHVAVAAWWQLELGAAGAAPPRGAATHAVIGEGVRG